MRNEEEEIFTINGKEEEITKEVEISVEVRMVMGNRKNWEDEYTQEEGVTVEAFGKRMMLEEQPITKEALLKTININ
jgi:hypothetical protein